MKIIHKDQHIHIHIHIHSMDNLPTHTPPAYASSSPKHPGGAQEPKARYKNTKQIKTTSTKVPQLTGFQPAQHWPLIPSSTLIGPGKVSRRKTRALPRPQTHGAPCLFHSSVVSFHIWIAVFFSSHGSLYWLVLWSSIRVGHCEDPQRWIVQP